MPIATSLFDDKQGALQSFLLGGVNALSQAINNSIRVGQDRATLQLNQENQVFNILKNQEDLRQRRAEFSVRTAENSRTFNRLLGRDVREDFVTDRAYTTGKANADRMFDFTKTNADRTYDLNKQQTAANIANQKADNTRQDASANITNSRNVLDILNLQENKRVADELRETTETLRGQARGTTSYDILGTPDQPKTLTNEQLSGYVDLFGKLPDPDIQGRVNTARRELQTREPSVDAGTGKVIPDRFATDRTNPFAEVSDPQEQIFVAQSLVQEIQDLQASLATAKGSAKSTITRLISQKKDQLRKAPVGIQKLSGGAVTEDDDPLGAFRK